MTPATLISGKTHRPAREDEPVTMAASLTPVVDALFDSARSRARAASAAAARDVRTELEQARNEAARILGEARADGARAAARRADAQLAAVRRDARGVVLSARRAAYDVLRRRATEALERQGATPSGRELGRLLETLARERVGAGSSVRRTGPGALSVRATAGNRHAAIGPAELVDAALRALAAEVESLWT